MKNNKNLTVSKIIKKLKEMDPEQQLPIFGEFLEKVDHTDFYKIDLLSGYEVVKLSLLEDKFNQGYDRIIMISLRDTLK